MLKLKEAAGDDFEFYYRLKCEQTAVYWSGFETKPNYENLQNFWLKIVEKKFANRRIFILYSDSLPQGYVQLMEDEEGIEFSMGIIEAARGKKYGNAIIRLAVQMCNTKKPLFCYIREDNLASIRSFENNGFKCTEKFHQQNFPLEKRIFRMVRYERKAPNIIAIIPARSGSKGLKDKNIRVLAGKPLMAYSIQAAQDSGLFETIHVSTDSKEYAEIARDYGADVPFLRDESYSGDTASSWDVVREVLIKYEKLGKCYDYCALLQPTSPLRTAGDIIAGFNLFRTKNASSVVSVTEVEHPVQWCFSLDSNLSMKNFSLSPYKNCRRQDLEKHFRENGALYITSTTDILNPDYDFYNEACYAYVMAGSRSIDIDSLQDFIIAEAIMKVAMED